MDNNGEPTLGDTVEQISLGKLVVRSGDALNELVLEQECQVAAQDNNLAGCAVSRDLAGDDDAAENPVPGIAGLALGTRIGYW